MADKRIRVGRPEEKFIYIDKSVGKLLPAAGEAELKVLLYALCEQEFSVAEAAAYLKITAGEVESALCFWRGAQLLDTAEAEKPAAHAKINLFQSYDGELLAKQVEENATFKTLCEFMEKKLEKLLNKNDLNSLFYLFDYVGLSAEYIMALTEYCVQKGKGSMQYILKTALGKADDGVDTYEKLEEWLRRKRSADDSVRRLAAACGWGDRELTANEKKYVRRWFEEEQASYELVHLAYEKTVDSIGKVKLAYMNKILESWFEKGYQTPEDVNHDRQAPKKKDGAEAGSSFDADDFFAAAVKKGMSSDDE